MNDSEWRVHTLQTLGPSIPSPSGTAGTDSLLEGEGFGDGATSICSALLGHFRAGVHACAQMSANEASETIRVHETRSLHFFFALYFSTIGRQFTGRCFLDRKFNAFLSFFSTHSDMIINETLPWGTFQLVARVFTRSSEITRQIPWTLLVWFTTDWFALDGRVSNGSSGAIAVRGVLFGNALGGEGARGRYPMSREAGIYATMFLRTFLVDWAVTIRAAVSCMEKIKYFVEKLVSWIYWR